MRFTVRALPPRLAATIATIALVAPLALVGCGPAPAATCGSGDDGSCLRVLFIGNRYTYVNDLPGTFAKLGQAGGHTVETDSLATDGAAPKNGAATSPRTTDAAIRRVMPEILTNPGPATVCRNHTDRLGPPAARQENP